MTKLFPGVNFPLMRKFGLDEYFCPVDFAVREAGTVWSAESRPCAHSEADLEEDRFTGG